MLKRLYCEESFDISDNKKKVLKQSDQKGVRRMKIIEGFNIEDKECQLELLQDDEPGLENIGAELKKTISIANMQGRRRVSNRRSSLHEMAASFMSSVITQALLGLLLSLQHQ